MTCSPLPCPFCGGTSFAILDEAGHGETDDGFTGDRGVFCNGCDAWGPMLPCNMTAIAGWNVAPRETGKPPRTRSACVAATSGE